MIDMYLGTSYHDGASTHRHVRYVVYMQKCPSRARAASREGHSAFGGTLPKDLALEAVTRTRKQIASRFTAPSWFSIPDASRPAEGGPVRVVSKVFVPIFPKTQT